MQQPGFVKQPLSAAKRRLQQLISCFLCNDKVRGANMCPHCCRLFCEGCIKCVLQNRSDCPNCHKSLKVSSLSQCSRFMNELSVLVQQLIEHRNLDELCLDHNVAQDYYCLDCLLPICCECSFFGEHHYHKVSHLKNIYEPKVDLVRGHLQNLKKEMKALETRCNELQPEQSGLKKEKGRLGTEIEETQQFYNLKILHDIVNKQTELEEVERGITLHIQSIQAFALSLEQSLGSSTPLHPAQSQRNEQQFQSLIQKEFDIPNYIQNEGDFLAEIFPEFYSNTYILGGFSSRVNSKQPIYSPSVTYDGNEWCLKIYSSGCQNVFGYYFTIFLQLKSSLCPLPMKYQYKIQLINHKSPTKNILRTFTSVFQPGENWGYQKYIQLGKLFKEGYISNNDCLVINYHIRSINYSNLSLQKECYIATLDQEILSQLKEIRELQNS